MKFANLFEMKHVKMMNERICETGKIILADEFVDPSKAIRVEALLHKNKQSKSRTEFYFSFNSVSKMKKLNIEKR